MAPADVIAAEAIVWPRGVELRSAPLARAHQQPALHSRVHSRLRPALVAPLVAGRNVDPVMHAVEELTDHRAARDRGPAAQPVLILRIGIFFRQLDARDVGP